ncbi:MAG: KpsF/GutQ family sugar-phosphate isomerase [Abditibacteriota bacterium]|nr:KpsF/GutQ family sugar-phosphate isomerase [Abditibacteriota bacterium]
MNGIDEAKLLKRGKETISREADNVMRMGDSLGQGFVDCCRAILASRGRVAMTGMGKSGLVAKKISATLASTGTPSFYLHPADAVHGDMGMITREDVVIALSNSGESGEIVNILPVIKRIGALLVGMTGRENSSLARYSDIVVPVVTDGEACPLGLAPTTSTTCQLAMGDAISLAVMEARQFTKDQYAVFHPGGALGKRLLLTVEDVMRTGDFVARVSPDTKLRDVLFAITEANAGAALVTGPEGLLEGIITDGDIRRALLSSEDNLHADARDIMSPNPVTIAPDKLATEALHRMEESGRKIGEMPVIRDGKPLGVICLKDLLTVGIV